MSNVTTGGDVDAYCSRCALDLAHVIVATSGPRIARVECKTCHTVHAYHPKGRTDRPSRATGSTPGRVPLHQREFDRLVAGKDMSSARQYQPSTRLELGALVRHPTFGTGIVARLLADDKVQIVFADAARVLVHGRQ